MGGTELMDYGTDYGTTGITYAGIGAYLSGNDWHDQKKMSYTIYDNNNLLETTTMNSVCKQYTCTSTISENYLRKYDYGSTSGSYILNEGMYNNSYDGVTWTIPAPIPPSERMRQMIQARMAPAFHRSRTSLSIAMDVREERARQTLRRIIGDQAFKKFMRDGFITVVPKSGLTYRIYPGSGMTEVYDRGIMVDRLCVVLQGEFPPTDSILMRYLLILNDEGEFSRYAIKHYVSQSRSTKLVFPTQEEAKPLTEAWAALKLKVA